MSGVRWLVLGLVTAAIAVGAGVPALRGRLAAADGLPVWEVARGAFVREVRADGNLEAVRATPLGPPADAQDALTIAWLAPDGSPVRAGDVVIRFDPSEMEQNLRNGRHDRATTDSRIAQKTVEEQGKEHNLERDAQMAADELDHAREFQSQDPEIFSRTQIIESEIDEQLATERQQHAATALQSSRTLAQTEMSLLGIQRRIAELKVDKAERGLRSLEVRAPHDGIFVLWRQWGRTSQVGQVVWGGEPVAELPQLDEMRAQVYVLEADAGGLEEGARATIQVESRPGVAYPGRVNQVDALAQRRDSDVPIQYFGVRVELERTDPAAMKPGQRVQAILELERQEDALIIPRQAVFDHEGQTVAWVRRGGRFDPVPIVLGPAALGRVVVASGLAPGEIIALADPTRRRDEAAPERDGAAEPAAQPAALSR